MLYDVIKIYTNYLNTTYSGLFELYNVYFSINLSNSYKLWQVTFLPLCHNSKLVAEILI